ncbi:MAG: DeoR/GlpR transcriptional regulator [Clostridiales bacterium]|nr:DeoR/GlpR transcriptional regulator [Clostridiales bacterium]
MSGNFRRRKIVEYVQRYGKVTYDQLCRYLEDVSEMTIRRDVAQLEKEGLIVKIRNGIRNPDGIGWAMEPKYKLRQQTNVVAKRALAIGVSEMIKPEMKLFFDAGSTLLKLAEIMPNDYYHITTSAPATANELLRRVKIDVEMLGGLYSRNTFSMTGEPAVSYVNMLSANYFDMAIMATSGFSFEYGFSCGNEYDAELKRAVMKKAKKVMMLLDESKIGKNMSYQFATLNDIDILVTECTFTDDQRMEIANCSVEYRYVDASIGDNQ